MENRIITVTGCHNCIFKDEEYEQQVCNEIARTGAKWVDSRGFHELYEENLLPLSCPLRREEITIVLKR